MMGSELKKRLQELRQSWEGIEREFLPKAREEEVLRPGQRVIEELTRRLSELKEEDEAVPQFIDSLFQDSSLIDQCRGELLLLFSTRKKALNLLGKIESPAPAQLRAPVRAGGPVHGNGKAAGQLNSLCLSFLQGETTEALDDLHRANEFGEKLRIMRREAGLSLRELHELSGPSHSYISQLENCKRPRPPSRKVAVKLDRAFSLNPHDQGSFSSIIGSFREPKEEKEEFLPYPFMRILSKMSSQNKLRLLHYAKELVGER